MSSDVVRDVLRATQYGISNNVCQEGFLPSAKPKTHQELDKDAVLEANAAWLWAGLRVSEPPSGEAAWSWAELEKESGVARETIYRIRDADNLANHRTLEAIAKALRVPAPGSPGADSMVRMVADLVNLTRLSIGETEPMGRSATAVSAIARLRILQQSRDALATELALQGEGKKGRPQDDGRD
jgi:hypothetical protein